MKLYSTYQFRLNPTESQVEQLMNISKNINEIYNYCLELNNERYKTERKIYTGFDLAKILTQYKQDKPEWFKINARLIGNTAIQLYNNYKSFFALIKKDKTAKPPKLIEDITKFRTLVFNQQGWNFKGLIGKENIIGINQIPIKYTSHKNIKDFDIKELRVKLTKNGMWLAQIIFEYEVETKSKEVNNKVLAIDLGLKILATGVDSDGNIVKIYNKPKKISKYFSKRINQVKSKQSKKVKGSRKWKRLQERKSKLYHKKNSQIRQYLHIKTKELVSMNYKTIVIGDLSVKELMMKEKSKWSGISKSFGNSNLNMFIQFLTYKSQRIGNDVVKIDERWTTQRNCLTKKIFNPRIELKDRKVKLSDEYTIDRDLNAAINIYNEWYSNHLATWVSPLPLSNVLVKNNLQENV